MARRRAADATETAGPELCRVCGRAPAEHHPCPICRDPLEHHPDGVTTDAEWAGLARMAAAKAAAGGGLTDLEAEALRRCPDPEFLCGDCLAYHPRGRHAAEGAA